MFKPPVVIGNKFDEPDDIIKGVIEQRRRLLTGFGGNSKASKERYDDALLPDHWAISLSGEATLYPKLPQLILKLKEIKTTRTIFLVTNGQEPDMLKKLSEMDALPTQLYISLVSPYKELYKKLALPFYKDGWERLLESLNMWKGFDTRKVIRITHIKGMNDDAHCAEQFARIITQSEPDFVEIKSYMHIGYSRRRLSKENMPLFAEVQLFAQAILSHLPQYSKIDEDEVSRIVLLKNNLSTCQPTI